MSVERALIEQCSPTLAKLKTASLFTTRYTSYPLLNKEVANWNKLFKEKGLHMQILCKKKDYALLYLYREDCLARDLSDPQRISILKNFDYENTDCQVDMLNRLKCRLATCDDFPHEIGIFLGYPPEDVYGFICNKGQKCTHCGYWKVYGDKQKAISLFEKFDKCKQSYYKLWQQGRHILQLTVA